MFTTEYNKALKQRTAYAQPVDESGKSSGKAIIIDEMKFDKKSLSKEGLEDANISRYNSGAYDITLSEDSSKILLVGNPPFEKYANEKFNYKVFDKDMKLVSETDVRLPYKDKAFSVYDYKLTPDGTIYQLAKVN